MWAGLIPGFLFGFLLKRSRMCLAGGLRDVYMEKRRSGLISMLLIIFTQSVVYFSLIRAGVLAMPEPKAFPLAATVIGGLLFGLGALIANGCITTTLVKVGDGRLAGFMSLFSFMIVGVASQKGFLSPLVAKLRAVARFRTACLPPCPSPRSGSPFSVWRWCSAGLSTTAKRPNRLLSCRRSITELVICFLKKSGASTQRLS